MMKLLILAFMIYFVFTLGACGSAASMPRPGLLASIFSAPAQVEDTTIPTVDAQFSHLSEDLEPTVMLLMVEGQLYCSTGREIDRDGRCGIMDGSISTSVERNLIPSRDGQSNFGAPYGYQYGDNGELEVDMAGHWMIFEPVQSPSTQRFSHRGPEKNS